MSVSIKIENLYKEYRLGVIGSGTLYRDLQSFWAKINNETDPNSIIYSTNIKKGTRFLALKNINLDISKGSVIGLIGANGAGKSTLLKIISKITSPTKGLICYNGRIASLLEVGTGFHPELTGRENIYLNASINGMSISETKSKLAEIVEFSGIGVHLDTPVKRYSSGMLVRLGFSVAAYLDPDILLIDEVLAVGDASFRNRAIQKIKDITNSKNKTIIFVSHNLDSVSQLCSKTILLDKGELIKFGETDKVIEHYLDYHNIVKDNLTGYKKFDKPKDSKPAHLLSITSKDYNDKSKSEFKISESLIIEIQYEVSKKGNYAVCIELANEKGNNILVTYDESNRIPWNNQIAKQKGIYKTKFSFIENFFEPGVIKVTVNIFTPPLPGNTRVDSQEKNFSIILEEDLDNINSSRGSYPYHWGSPIIRPKIDVKTEFNV